MTALVGRVPRGQIASAFGLFVLYIVQTALPNARAGAPVIAALHPANTMLMLAVGIIVGVRARRIATADRLT